MESTPLKILGSNGNSLQFDVDPRAVEEGTLYTVQLRTPWMSATTQMPTHVYGPPTTYFKDLAASWRGWEGQKLWENIEHQVSLSATTDPVGHISLMVTLRSPIESGFPGKAVDVIALEAGALEALAREVRQFFG